MKIMKTYISIPKSGFQFSGILQVVYEDAGSMKTTSFSAPFGGTAYLHSVRSTVREFVVDPATGMVIRSLFFENTILFRSMIMCSRFDSGFLKNSSIFN